ncbi:Z protein [Mopeia virus AN20410]|uniref:RING finger protein Z n=2 Tax=Mopeia virus TaxID=3052320 RepID=Q5S584_MOPEI|nr:Z protein [Mopeia Lassa virus reassortant 29]YP_170707.1 Z protein [Mopeia virus AN20410]AEO89357.1 Z protein [Mammarenavirus mopeiaense]AAV54102.1 Z protein [Mopeia Lassa virus reassortant 29]AAV54106.1 Z protein [Mopeia virus AN20410]AFY05533.1 Z protein [Mopeia Lassa virus reassortant 29]AFY05535.1 Z protein [Mopeia Lassa virus reassortant 29]
MGKTQSKGQPSTNLLKETEPRHPVIPDARGTGPEFCKSCWFERRGLVRCNDHYLCLNCLTLLHTVSDRCPICKHKLPFRLELQTQPTAPPEIPPSQNPPPYSP